MKREIGKKTIKLIGVMFCMSILVFFSIRIMPGDPLAIMYGEKSVSAEVMERTRRLYNLDKPMVIQYVDYVSNFIRGDFGYSYFHVGTAVSELIGKKMKITFTLALAAFPIAVFGGLLLGTLSVYFRGRLFDRVMNGIVAVFTAIPDIPLASFLVFCFAVKLQWFPIAGWGDVQHMILPVFFVALWPMLNLCKVSRSLLNSEIGKPYIFMCRTRGMGWWSIIWSQCMPNIRIPLFTKLSMLFAHMLEGALVAEIVFNIPGLARCSVDAIARRDYPVVMAVVLLTTFIYTFVNYCMEMFQIFLDPRLREDEIIEQ